MGEVVVCPALLMLVDPCQWPFVLQSMLKGQQSPSVRDITLTVHSVDCISAPEEKQKKKGNGGLEVCPTVCPYFSPLLLHQYHLPHCPGHVPN